MAVIANMNILVIGKTGVGKTAFMSMLGGLIPLDRRILVIEDTRELDLRPGDLPQNCVYYTNVSRTNSDAKNVAFADLIRMALRQRPDHLIVGESRGAEFDEILKGVKTGHDGNITSIHAASIAEVSTRVEDMLRMARPNDHIDQRIVNNEISTNFHVAVHLLLNLTEGRRYVNQIAAFSGRTAEDRASSAVNHEVLFEGGSKQNYYLTLAQHQTHLERRLNEYGFSFDQVAKVYEAEQKLRKEVKAA
jgi:pilus assembly protein CpaF